MNITDAWLAVPLALSGLAELTFVLCYATFPWWKSTLGRLLFSTAIVAAIVLLSASAGLAWDWPNENVFRMASYVALVPILWGQTFVFLSLRDRAAKHQREFPETDWGSQ